MGFNLFKKKQAEASTPEVKIVEKVVEKEVKVEVPMASRFTFAHDPDVEVKEFYLSLQDGISYNNLGSNTMFIYDSIADTEEGCELHPVFLMPSTLPTKKLVTPKKVICIGTIVTDMENDDEICSIANDYTGLSLEEMVMERGLADGKLPTEDTTVYVTNYENIIREEIVEGDIGYAQFETFCTLGNTIKLITNDSNS